MNHSNDPVMDRIESAERMLRQARAEHARGYAEDADEFLRAAARHIGGAQEALKTKPISFSDRKEVAHAR